MALIKLNYLKFPSGKECRFLFTSVFLLVMSLPVMIPQNAVGQSKAVKEALKIEANIYEKQLKLAEKGDVDAQVYVARKQKGQNSTNAVYWFRKAAEQGNAEAQLNMGVFYAEGYCEKSPAGIKKNPEQAFQWFCKAADQGNVDGIQMCGLCYSEGFGVSKDSNRAVEYFRKAAEQGHVLAQNSLGFCYENGNGVAQDYNQAFEWYKKAADQGLAEAQNNVGICYENGNGVAQDYNQAFEYYKKAAEQKLLSANYHLAVCYQKGYGTEKDYDRAFAWFKRYAERDYALAQYRLGECYEYGYGVSIDYNQALNWYNKAIKLGNKYAENAYENCFIKSALDYIRTYQYNPNLDDGSDSYLEFIQVCVVLKNKYKGNDTLNAQINNGIIEKVAEMNKYHKYLSTVMFYEGRPTRELSLLEKSAKFISGGRAAAIGEVAMPTWTDKPLVNQLIDQFDIYKIGLELMSATGSNSLRDRDKILFGSGLTDNLTINRFDEYLYCFPESPYYKDVQKIKDGYQTTVAEIESRRAEEYQRSETYAKNYVNKNVKAVIDDDVNTAVIFGSTINCSITIYGKCTYASKYGNDATYEIDVSSISITRKDGRTLDNSDYKCLYDRWNQKSVKLESRNRNFKGIWVQ